MIGYTSPEFLRNMDLSHRRVQFFLMSEELGEREISQMLQTQVVNMTQFTPPPNIMANWHNRGNTSDSFMAFVNEYYGYLHNNGMFGMIGTMMNVYQSKMKDIIFLCSYDELCKLRYMDAFAEILAQRYGVEVWNPNMLVERHASPKAISEYRMTAQGEQMMMSDFNFGQQQMAQTRQQIQPNAPYYPQLPNQQHVGQREMRPSGYVNRIDYGPGYNPYNAPNPYQPANQMAMQAPAQVDNYEIPQLLKKHMVQDSSEYYFPTAPDPLNMYGASNQNDYGIVPSDFSGGAGRGMRLRNDGYQYNAQSAPMIPCGVGAVNNIQAMVPQQGGNMFPMYQPLSETANPFQEQEARLVYRETPPYKRRGKKVNPKDCEQIIVQLLDE